MQHKMSPLQQYYSYKYIDFIVLIISVITSGTYSEHHVLSVDEMRSLVSWKQKSVFNFPVEHLIHFLNALDS